MSKSFRQVSGTSLSSLTPQTQLNSSPVTPAIPTVTQQPVATISEALSGVQGISSANFNQNALTPVGNSFSRIPNPFYTPTAPASLVSSIITSPNLSVNVPAITADLYTQLTGQEQQFSNSTNLESGQTNTASQRLFTNLTGLSDNKPSLVFTSEFIPLYEDSSKKNTTGNSLSLKETAKIITAKTAISLLSQSSGINDVIIQNKQQILQFVSTENNFTDRLMSEIGNVYDAMSLKSYITPPNFFPNQRLRFEKILLDSGYSQENISKYTETKLWKQVLIEVKKSVSTHTNFLIDESYARRDVENDDSSIYLSDIERPPSSLLKLWLNPLHVVVPSSLEIVDTRKIETNRLAIRNLEKGLYINLPFANSPTSGRVSTVNSQSGGLGLSRFALEEIELINSSDVLDQYESTGRDINVSANAVLKEAIYSSYLLDQSNISKLSEYGYQPSVSGDNFAVWDHLIGRFSKTIFEFPTNPIGQGKALSSLSNAIQASDNQVYNVLTFEKNFATNATPGSYYYVDSTVSSKDGTTVDTSRLNSLTRLLEVSQETLKTVYELSGYESTFFGDHRAFRPKNVSEELDFFSIVYKLSQVTDLYKKVLDVQSNFTETFLINYDKMTPSGPYSQVQSDDYVNVRLASLICKCTVQPIDSTVAISANLKSYLFLFLMSKIVIENTPSNDPLISTINTQSTLSTLKEKIVNSLTRTNQIITENRWRETINRGLGYSLDQTTFVDPDLESISFTGFSVGGAPIDQTLIDLQRARQEIKSMSDTGKANYNEAVKKRLFGGIDTQKGLWKVIYDLMTSVYNNSIIFSQEKTGYTGLDKTAFMYGYFDMLMRIVASQTPENFLGSYTYTNTVILRTTVGSGTRNVRTVESNLAYVERGLLVQEATPVQVINYFNREHFDRNEDAYLVSKRLKQSVANHRSESTNIKNQLDIFRSYMKDLSASLVKFKTFVEQSLTQQIQKLSAIYSQDNALDANKKRDLLNISLTPDQVKLQRYIMSEICDRITGRSDFDTPTDPQQIVDVTRALEDRLRKIPSFSDFPENFSNFLPVNEFDLFSYSLLSSFFKSNQFLRIKGNNKKVMSVGIPPQMFRFLYSSNDPTLSSSPLKRIVKIYIWKIDRLHPEIVYKPVVRLFELDRYPTRVLNNWDQNVLMNDDFNLLSMPSKYVTSYGGVVLSNNYLQAFPIGVYGNSLTEEEKRQIYANHAVSFLSEEYIRWFTDSRFDETRYDNYTQLDNRSISSEQLVASIPYISAQAQASPAASVAASIIDPTSGQALNLPVTNSPSPASATLRDSVRERLSRLDPNSIIQIDLTETLKSFFSSETFLIRPLNFYRKISYPKKFDRVFNMIIDPDDFYVDETVTKTSDIQALKNIGVLSGGPAGGVNTNLPYKHRDTLPQDISFDEYFVTVAPYDYNL
jgi:hypothetical protein